MIEVPDNLMKYWLDGLHELYLDFPDRGLYPIYESMMKLYQKERGKKNVKKEK